MKQQLYKNNQVKCIDYILSYSDTDNAGVQRAHCITCVWCPCHVHALRTAMMMLNKWNAMHQPPFWIGSNTHFRLHESWSRLPQYSNSGGSSTNFHLNFNSKNDPFPRLVLSGSGTELETESSLNSKHIILLLSIIINVIFIITATTKAEILQ